MSRLTKKKNILAHYLFLGYVGLVAPKFVSDERALTKCKSRISMRTPLFCELLGFNFRLWSEARSTETPFHCISPGFCSNYEEGRGEEGLSVG